MDPHEKLVYSSGKAYSPSIRSIRHTQDAPSYLLQLSYQELFRESGKVEPRLSRLLGHISLHENVARWQAEVETGLQSFNDGKEAVLSKKAPKSNHAFHLEQKADRGRVKATLSTLVEFQAFMREQIDSKEAIFVVTEDVCSDCDSEAELGSEETRSNE